MPVNERTKIIQISTRTVCYAKNVYSWRECQRKYEKFSTLLRQRTMTTASLKRECNQSCFVITNWKVWSLFQIIFIRMLIILMIYILCTGTFPRCFFFSFVGCHSFCPPNHAYESSFSFIRFVNWHVHKCRFNITTYIHFGQGIFTI